MSTTYAHQIDHGLNMLHYNYLRLNAGNLKQNPRSNITK